MLDGGLCDDHSTDQSYCDTLVFKPTDIKRRDERDRESRLES